MDTASLGPTTFANVAAHPLLPNLNDERFGRALCVPRALFTRRISSAVRRNRTRRPSTSTHNGTGIVGTIGGGITSINVAGSSSTGTAARKPRNAVGSSPVFDKYVRRPPANAENNNSPRGTPRRTAAREIVGTSRTCGASMIGRAPPEDTVFVNVQAGWRRIGFMAMRKRSSTASRVARGQGGRDVKRDGTDEMSDGRVLALGRSILGGRRCGRMSGTAANMKLSRGNASESAA